MDASFIPIEVVPSKTPFGLDQLRRSYKTGLSAEDAIAAAPAVGTADETFAFMFLMPITTPESAESATRIDLVYMGCLSGEEAPTLPAQKTDDDVSVQSASSSKNSNGQVLTAPATIQFYAPQKVLTYFSFEAPGTDIPADPTGDPLIITLTIGDTSYSAGSGGVQATVNLFFSMQIITTIESTEVVPGKYWQNVARKTKSYAPFIFDIEPGPYLSLFSAGVGYTVSDILTISSGGESATIVVDQVGSIFGIGGGIVAFHTTANDFTVNITTGLYATGGTGSGAGFNVFIVPM